MFWDENIREKTFIDIYVYLWIYFMRYINVLN